MDEIKNPILNAELLISQAATRLLIFGNNPHVWTKRII